MMLVEIWITQTSVTQIHKFDPEGVYKYFTMRRVGQSNYECEGMHDTIEDCRDYDVYDDTEYLFPGQNKD